MQAKHLGLYRFTTWLKYVNGLLVQGHQLKKTVAARTANMRQELH